MEMTDFLASVKSEVLEKEDEDLPVVDINLLPGASLNDVVMAETLDVSSAPIDMIDIKKEQVVFDENAAGNTSGDEEKNLILDSGEILDATDPNYQPGSESESDDDAVCQDHDYTPMAGADPSSLMHIEILDCQQQDPKKKGYRCPHCLYTTKRRQHYEMHIVCHSDEKPYKCDKCDFRTARKLALSSHVKHLHESGKVYKCEKCKFTTKYSHSLKLHMKVHSEERNYSCPQCDFTTKHWLSLKSHLTLHTDEKSLKCQFCDFRTKHQASMYYHRKVHSSERSYKCDKCSFTAASSSNLKQHQLGHSDDRPFSCELCPLKFKSTSLLKKHIKFTHLKVKPHKCEICGKRFSSRGNLQRHQIVHNGPKEVFKCPECGIGFTLESNLKRHQKKHDNPVSYRCRLCHGTFTELVNLRRHINTVHLRAIQIPCPYCSKTLTTGTGLRRHIKVFHPERWSEEKHGARVKTKQFTKKSVAAVVSKKAPVCDETGSGLAESCSGGEIDNQHQKRRRLLPRDDNERTIIEPEYDVELIETLSRLDTSPEVVTNRKKTSAKGTKELSSTSGVQKRRGRPPKSEKLNILKGKSGKKSKLVIRKPLAYTNKLGKKPVLHVKAAARKQRGKLNVKTNESPRRKRGRPPKVKAGIATSSSQSSSQEASTVDNSETLTSSPEILTSLGRKRGRPKKLLEGAANSSESIDETSNDCSNSTNTFDFSSEQVSLIPKTKRGRPRKNIINIAAETSSTTDIERGDQDVESVTESSSQPQVVKKRRGRPPKNRMSELQSISEADIVYDSDIPVGSTCSEIGDQEYFRKTGQRCSAGDGLYDIMIPLTTSPSEEWTDLSEQDRETEMTDITDVEWVPDADHLYAAAMKLSATSLGLHDSSHCSTPDVPSVSDDVMYDADISEENESAPPGTFFGAVPTQTGSGRGTSYVVSDSPPRNPESHLERNQGHSGHCELVCPASSSEAAPVKAHTQVMPEVAKIYDKPAEAEPEQTTIDTVRSSSGGSIEAAKAPFLVKTEPSDIPLETWPMKSPVRTETLCVSSSEVSGGENSGMMELATISSRSPDGEMPRNSETDSGNLQAPSWHLEVTTSDLEVINLDSVTESEKNATVDLRQPNENVGNQANDIEQENGTSCEVDADAQKGDESGRIISSKEQSDVLTYFGLQRKQMEGDLGRDSNHVVGSGTLNVASGETEQDHLVGSGALNIASVKTEQSGTSSGIRLGSMRDVSETLPDGCKQMSSLLREARLMNNIKGRPWIVGTAKERQQYLEEKARMAAGKVRNKGGRPPKKKQGIQTGSLAKGGTGRPKGSKNRVTKWDNLLDSTTKSGRQPKASWKIRDNAANDIEIDENGQCRGADGQKRKFSAKFQCLIDSLISNEDDCSESDFSTDSDVDETSPSLRKSARVSKLSAKKKCVKSGTTESDEGVSKKVHSKRACFQMFPARRARDKLVEKVAIVGGRQKSVSVTRKSEKQLEKGSAHVKKNKKLTCIGTKKLKIGSSAKTRGRPPKGSKNVKSSDESSLKGPNKTAGKQKSDKGTSHGPCSDKKKEGNKVNNVKKGPLLSSTGRKVRSDKGISKKAVNTRSGPTSSAAASDQNFCMVSMNDFSNLLATAGTVVYVLPAESHLGKLAAANNSVMCLVPKNENVVIPPGAIPVQAVSGSSSVDHNKSKESGVEKECKKPRKTRSDKGKPKGSRKSSGETGTDSLELNSDTAEKSGESESAVPRESDTGEGSSQSHEFAEGNGGLSAETDSGIGLKKRRKERSDKGMPRKRKGSPGQAEVPAIGGDKGSQMEGECLRDGQSVKKRRRTRSDKGVPRKRLMSPNQAESSSALRSEQVPGNEAESRDVPAQKKARKEGPDATLPSKPRESETDGNNTGVENGGIYLDPRECISFSGKKPRKVRSDKGIPKGPRKPKGQIETDSGTVVLTKKSGRPKIIQTSRDNMQNNSSSECPGGQQTCVSSPATVSKSRRPRKSGEGHDKQPDFIIGSSKRVRKPKVDADFVSFEELDAAKKSKEAVSNLKHGITLQKPSSGETGVVKKTRRPRKKSAEDAQHSKAQLKVVIPKLGDVVPSSSNAQEGDSTKAAVTVSSPVTISRVGKKHTARKSFPQAAQSLPSRSAQTHCLYSDIFPGGGIPVPVTERNPLLSQIARSPSLHGGQETATGYQSPRTETERAVSTLTQSDITVQEELMYVDLVVDPASPNVTEQYSLLATQTEGVSGTVVSGIEAQSQPLDIQIIDASQWQSLIDSGVIVIEQENDS